ncbi:MAG: hypothetical protein RI964_605 [Pseudomonadota bacterium]
MYLFIKHVLKGLLRLDGRGYGALCGAMCLALLMNSAEAANYKLGVVKDGNGTVVSTPLGINCGDDCSESYPSDTPISLSATPDAGYEFYRWAGCSSVTDNVCTISLASNKNVIVIFKPLLALNVSKTGTGSGSVVSTPAGIDCGSQCSKSYLIDSYIWLKATPSIGSRFMGWSGVGSEACGTAANCRVQMTAARQITARFDTILTVSNGGNGVVTSSDEGIVCGTTCTNAYAVGSTVTLTATPDSGYGFYRWSGCSSVAWNVCTVNVDASKNVTVKFQPVFRLDVSKAGTGKGLIVSNPLGIYCGAKCSASYFKDRTVTLQATPANGSRFIGWYGNGAEACGIATTCQVSMSAARQVVAQFDLSLMVGHNGNGKVTSSDGGIDCGTDCGQVYVQDTVVALTATPDTGYGLANWSGCSGIQGKTCLVKMSVSKNVTATFKPLVTLSVTKQGSVGGLIRSTPMGIYCGTSCTTTVVADSLVTLKATPATNAFFMGWMGACSGTGDCVVTMSAAKQVTAVFGRLANKGKYWVTGYLPGYTQGDNGEIPFMRSIDWQTVTHVIHHSALPNADGSLDVDLNSVNAVRRQAAIKTAHAQGVPILFGLSGWGNRYRPVLADAGLRTTLINNVLAILDEGYDGIDVDFEPIVWWGEEENPEYEAFINELYAALQTRTTPLLNRPLLTVSAIYREHKLLARLQDKFDQINIMAYDQSGTVQGITWHDSALYSGGYVYPSTGNPVMSVDYYIKTCLAAGIPAAKLGLGISLETRLWIGGDGTTTGGVSLPYQTWTSEPRHFMSDYSVPKESYATLLDKYYDPAHAYWDDAAKVPYLSFDLLGSANDMFISYNNERAVQEKLNYMRGKRLGGMMLWQLQYDYRPAQTGDLQRPIVSTIRESLY